MTGTDPLNKNGNPPHRKTRTVKLELEEKMVQIKTHSVPRSFVLIYNKMAILPTTLYLASQKLVPSSWVTSVMNVPEGVPVPLTNVPYLILCEM